MTKVTCMAEVGVLMCCAGGGCRLVSWSICIFVGFGYSDVIRIPTPLLDGARDITRCVLC